MNNNDDLNQLQKEANEMMKPDPYLPELAQVKLVAEEIADQIILAPQQAEALALIDLWYRDPSRQVFYLAGYAGTGKSTMARKVYDIVRKVKGRRPRIEIATYTGKAALVLKTKGWALARTIHSLIYKLDEQEGDDGEPVFILNRESDLYDADLLIIDEVSMVGQEVGADLVSFGKKILVLGDPGQLPPIDGAGYFTAGQPDFLLTEIHRQALDSPIIRWATAVRTGRGLSGLNWSEGDSQVMKRAFTAKGSKPPLHLYSTFGVAANQTICGLNATRHVFNAKLRQLEMPGCPAGQPIVGDKLICLKNNHEKGLLNGGMWKVESTPELMDRAWRMEVTSLDLEGVQCEINVPMEFFTGTAGDLQKSDLFEKDQFDFGYAITCHKSQGSQWDKVFIYNENWAFRENAARWLYTAITRAAKSVVIAL